MTRNRRHPFGALWQEFNQVQDEFAKWFGPPPAWGPARN